MKHLLHLSLVFAFILTLTGTTMAQTKPKVQAKAPAKKEQVYRHVVIFKFKDASTPEQIKAVEDAFAALPKKINTIIDYEWGTNVSPENLNQGFTHCFFVTFKDRAGLDVYLPHPEHKAFGKLLGPHLDKVLVLDYVSKN